MPSVATKEMTRTVGAETVADAIENTLEWLDKQGCGAPESERRNTRRSRYRVGAKIAYVPPGADKTHAFEVVTRNLSRTGLSFIHKTLIYPRQHVDVQLPLPDRSVRHLRGRVIRVRPAGIGIYEIGVEFTELEVAVV
ncbi:MAG TPA: PilZ domain-containing protein [Phycisphaerae bacterium]|nr:PilZ domain-containing protein [Phycisphaerae bacterium]